ncbi:hypothetical protein MXZ31_05540 [Streptococcus uberis]|nr:hypothetical protein [Streptococcus uberis]MCK1209303.1 hypothetical protein [Streptococcus uberis]
MFLKLGDLLDKTGYEVTDEEVEKVFNEIVLDESVLDIDSWLPKEAEQSLVDYVLTGNGG